MSLGNAYPVEIGHLSPCYARLCYAALIRLLERHCRWYICEQINIRDDGHVLVLGYLIRTLTLRHLRSSCEIRLSSFDDSVKRVALAQWPRSSSHDSAGIHGSGRNNLLSCSRTHHTRFNEYRRANLIDLSIKILLQMIIRSVYVQSFIDSCSVDIQRFFGNLASDTINRTNRDIYYVDYENDS